MPVHSVVLHNESSVAISPETLTEVARALQIQVNRDFVPLWPDVEPVPVTASLTENFPAESSPIHLVDDVVDEANEHPLGVHVDPNGRPEAFVRVRPDWTITASHELLEMLADPEGTRTWPAPDVERPDVEVEYLVEVCDPCQVYDYPIRNVAVSDFVVPAYFEPEEEEGRRIDFLRRLSRPREVPPGCSLSWFDPATGLWHQRQPDGQLAPEAPSTGAHTRRDDRDRAYHELIGELRHDLLAARRAPLLHVAERLIVDELLTQDPTMQRIIERAREKNGWTDEDQTTAVREYGRHLMLRYLHPGVRVAALSKLGDQLWHEHIIDTVKYWNDCYRLFGETLEHEPFYEPPVVPPGQDARIQAAVKLYTQAFGPPITALAQTSH